MENTFKSDCIFCKIAAHDAPARVVLENDSCIAFHDIKPEAATHVLVVPKTHIEKFSDLDVSKNQVLLDLMRGVIEVIQVLHLENNCKIAINNGHEAGQIVPHVHAHILSTKKT